MFVNAMREAGFIDGAENGDAQSIHDWDVYAGRLIEKREKNAEKQREWRSRNRDAKATDQPPDGDEQPRDEDVTVTQPSRGGATVPNRTNQTEPNHGDPLPPDGAVYPEEFESEFWQHYPKGRGSKARAFAIWKRLNAADRRTIVEVLPVFRAGRDWREGFQPAPDVWLRGRCWENPPDASLNGHASNRSVTADHAGEDREYLLRGLKPVWGSANGGIDSL
jgi:hypothetical protein